MHRQSRNLQNIKNLKGLFSTGHVNHQVIFVASFRSAEEYSCFLIGAYKEKDRVIAIPQSNPMADTNTHK